MSTYETPATINCVIYHYATCIQAHTYSLSVTGDRGRPPPPSSAPTRDDQSRHNNS